MNSTLRRPPVSKGRRRRLGLVGAALALVLAGCSAGTDEPVAEEPTEDATPGADGGAEGQDPATDDEGDVGDVGPVMTVLASFYALQYAVEQVGGDLVEVSSLTPPGIDPHDLELSPRQVRTVADVDAVVYLSGFQAAVDEAVTAREPQRLLDVLDVVELRAAGEHTHDHDHDHDHDEDGHDHGSLPGGLDPHFWLDPIRMSTVGHEIARVLGEASPEHADTFGANASDLEAAMAELDAAYVAGLAQCERDVVVTGHAAFGYLAEAYGFTEVGIAGIDPETEPSPARLREIGAVVAEHGVTTIFAEDPVNPAVAASLAGSLGLEVDLLDPIETQADAARDYRDVMQSNLTALRAGLGCA